MEACSAEHSACSLGWVVVGVPTFLKLVVAKGIDVAITPDFRGT